MNLRQKQKLQDGSAHLAEIYDTYQRPIYAHIFHRVNDMETARDLTADVFQRLLLAMQKGDKPIRNVKAWLYRTTHNLVTDFYRRQQFRDCEPLEESFAADTRDPAQEAAELIQLDGIRRAWHELTPEQRQVLSLRFLDGLACTETAEIMNKSTGAVKSLQHRALAALRREIERQEESRLTAVANAGTQAVDEKKGWILGNPSPLLGNH